MVDDRPTWIKLELKLIDMGEQTKWATICMSATANIPFIHGIQVMVVVVLGPFV